MKHGKKSFLSASVLLVTSIMIVSAQPVSASADETERNKKIVKRYFVEIIDRMGVGDASSDQWQTQTDEVEKVFDELFAADAIQHFPGLPPSPPKGLLNVIKRGLNMSMKTTFHHLIAEGDLVLAHVSHALSPKSGSKIPSPRIGCLIPSDGETVRWEAMALFKLKNGKIVEEWISRDDLGLLLQTGKLVFDPCTELKKK